jgi:hypothetical protein
MLSPSEPVVDKAAPNIALAVLVLAAVANVAGLLPLLPFVLIGVGVNGFLLGRWSVAREHEQHARQAAIRVLEEFVGDLHCALIDEQVPAEHVEECELLIATCCAHLQELDASRRWGKLPFLSKRGLRHKSEHQA